ncbi:hypothetical protein F5887DRAFT_1245570 [Amanita rubescens]|nr:hypothetical protein F5887DRAFT_1245570 [Amanita rubescens]
MPVVQPDSRILVTGGNSYVGVGTIRALLEQRFAVRATVRSKEKNLWLEDLFKEYNDKFELVIVEDIKKTTPLFYAKIPRSRDSDSSAAHARVSEEFKAEFAGSLPASARSIKQIHSYMDELARRCKVEAQSFDDHMRICFCSTGYVQLLLEHVVRDINVGPVLEVGSRLF